MAIEFTSIVTIRRMRIRKKEAGDAGDRQLSSTGTRTWQGADQDCSPPFSDRLDMDSATLECGDLSPLWISLTDDRRNAPLIFRTHSRQLRRHRLFVEEGDRQERRSTQAATESARIPCSACSGIRKNSLRSRTVTNSATSQFLSVVRGNSTR